MSANTKGKTFFIVGNPFTEGHNDVDTLRFQEAATLEMVSFDAMTAAAIAHHLDLHGIEQGLVAELLLRAAESKAQASSRNVRVMITGWSARGGAIIPGDDAGSMNMRIVMADQTDTAKLKIVGILSRTGQDALNFQTNEMLLENKGRFFRAYDGGLRLEIRQRLPDTILNGMSVLAGRPLAAIVEHPSLQRPEAAGVKIVSVHQPKASTVRRTESWPTGIREGVDVEIVAPLVEMASTRRKHLGDGAGQ